MDYLRIWNSRSELKNYLKIGFEAVHLTELSSSTNRSKITLFLILIIFQLNNYHKSSNWNISPVIDVS